MKLLDAKKQSSDIINFFNTKVYNMPDWKAVKDKSANAVSSGAAYEEYKAAEIIPFDKMNYDAAKKIIKNNEPIDFVEEDNLENTMFGRTFLGSADNVFGGNTEQNLEQSFIINGPFVEKQVTEVSQQEDIKEQLSNLDMESLEKVSNGASIEEVTNDSLEKEESLEMEEPAKVKTLKPNKKAAYVDTVILCLIAQLSIFGLLIIVLLVIK